MSVRGVLCGVVRICVYLFIASIALGCLALVGPETPAPQSLGEHPVGVSTITVADPTRNRELTVEVWYPASATATATAAEPVIYRVTAAGLLVAQLRSAAGALRNADAWQEGGPRPVVLMSHGSGSSRFANVSLSEVLASHGYIVAAPDHAGHTMEDHVFGIDADERAQSAFDRPLDLSRVLDALARRSRTRTSFLNRLVDSERVAVAGHSFGGATALGMVGARFDATRQQHECLADDSDRRCRAVPVFGPGTYRYRDDRIKAAMLITPGGYDFYRADGIAQVNAPTLIVGARRDVSNPFAEYHRSVFDALTGPRYLLDLKDAGHLTPTDICSMVDSIGFLAQAFGGAEAEDGCGDDYPSTRDTLDRVADAALPFFDLYLNGNRGARKALRLALHTLEDDGHAAAAVNEAGPL